jgi:hypothetical protein
MTLDTTLLQRLADWRFERGPQALNVVDPGSGWAVALMAECVGQVGCSLLELELRPPGGLPAGDLAGRANRVASRVTGLLERLRVVEVDAAAGTALLRSDTPSTGDGVLSYYEVLVRGDGSAAVRRYRAPQGGRPRWQVTFALTYEALAKLVRDLADEQLRVGVPGESRQNGIVSSF